VASLQKNSEKQAGMSVPEFLYAHPVYPSESNILGDSCSAISQKIRLLVSVSGWDIK